jgi:DNA-binding transcriptional regulator YdaS (Cro superfamily)
LTSFAKKFIYETMACNLKAAVEKAGGYSKLAGKLANLGGEPVSKQVVWSWVNVLGRIPAERVMAFEEATGIPRYKIRPDIYPENREIT